MAKTIALDKKGLAEIPIYPCYKADGKCQLRITGADEFKCIYNGATCRYRKAKVKGE